MALPPFIRDEPVSASGPTTGFNTIPFDDPEEKVINLMIALQL